MKKLRLACIANYAEANRYLGEDYIAEHNRRYARPAAEAADYHRRRPTARQLDPVFWLEEERVVSEDWVVRYKNRLLQLERQSQHWAPAKSRVLVRENQAGEVAILYRGQPLAFRELPRASATLSEGRGAAPSPAPPSPKPNRRFSPASNHPWRRARRIRPVVRRTTGARTDRRVDSYPKTHTPIGPAGSIITDPWESSRTSRKSERRLCVGRLE